MRRPTRRTAVADLLPALAAVLLLLTACDSQVSSAPSPEAIATAESLSRAVSIDAPASTTPEKGDDERGPVVLEARVFGRGPTGVILAHQRPSDGQSSWFPFATELANTGQFTVLTFSFRGYGASTGDKTFDRLDTDLTSALGYMRETLGLRRVFLVGASMGGTASIVVAGREAVAGVVSISSPAQFETLDATASVRGLRVPKLFLASKDDVPAERSVQEFLAAAPDPKDQMLYEGDAHGTDLFAGPHATEVAERVIAFLSQ